MPSAAVRRLGRDTIAAGGISFVLAQASVNVSNFGFHAIASRLLGPIDYGALGALLVVTAALAVPVTAFETIVTARVAQAIADGEEPNSAAVHRRAVLTGVGASAFLLAVAPFLHAYLHLSSWAPLGWLALDTIPMAASVVPWGMLCGQRQFRVAGSTALGAAVLRIAFMLVFVSVGFGLSGALAAGVCADGVRASILWVLARRRTKRLAGIPVVLRIEGGQVFAGLVVFAGLWILMGTDTLFARHLLSASQAGLYIASTTVGRIAFFLPLAGSMLAVPAFAVDGNRNARTALWATLAVIASFGVLLAGTVGVLGPRFLPLAFGHQYRFSSGLLFIVGMAATEMAMVWATVQYRLARRQRCVIPGWLGVGVALVLVAAIHPDMRALALIAAAAAGLTFVLAVAPVLLEANPDQRTALAAASWPLVGNDVADLDLTVVVPFYNPGDLLRPNVLNLVEALRRADVRFEVIAVSDGCTDGSPLTIADLEPSVVRTLALPRNAGKGAALRLGLAEGRGRYLGFIDADGDLDPALWEPFLGLVRLYRPDVIAGSKRHALSDVDPTTSWSRRAASWGYQTLVRLLFPSLPLRDTQVGIKVFRREVLMDVLPRTVERGFVFDLEVLAVARRLGYRRIMSAPVTLHRNGLSTIKLRTVWAMFADTFALAYRVYVRRGYDVAPSTSATPTMALATRQLGVQENPIGVWGGAGVPAALSPAAVP